MTSYDRCGSYLVHAAKVSCFCRTNTLLSVISTSLFRKEDDRAALVAAAANAKNIIVFSGSGLSASSGMSMFSTRGGLYEKACKRFQLSDGKHLFSWKFYAGRRADVTSFFVDIHKEARKAEPGKAQQAVASLHANNKLLRHYTMNVDGLATHVRPLL